MRKAFTLLALIISSWHNAHAQVLPADTLSKSYLHHAPASDNKYVLKPRTEKKKETADRQLEAFDHIKALKNGVLVVRLRTSENAIKNLEKAGNSTMAATLRNRQRMLNLHLIEAFRTGFTFCPVYFFYSSDTNKFLNAENSGFFLNDSLAIDTALTLPAKTIYVAEITDLEQLRPDPDDLNASNNAEVSFKALVVRDNLLHQLTKPFPYFIKAAQNFPPRKRSEKEMVANLNENLKAFYDASLVKKRKRKITGN